MATGSLQDKYLKKLSSEVRKLEIEMEIFGVKAERAVGLAKAKYVEQMKNVQRKRDHLSWAMKEIIEGKDDLGKTEFWNKVEKLLKEISEVTEAKKQRLINLFR